MIGRAARWLISPFRPFVPSAAGVQSTKVDQGHDCRVLVLQALFVRVAQRVVILDDAVAAELAIAEEAEERHGGEHLAEGAGFHVALVVVVPSSPHAGEHEPQGVPLGDFGRFQPTNGGLSLLWVDDVLVQQHGGSLHLRTTQGQAHYSILPKLTATM